MVRLDSGIVLDDVVGSKVDGPLPQCFGISKISEIIKLVFMIKYTINGHFFMC